MTTPRKIIAAGASLTLVALAAGTIVWGDSIFVTSEIGGNDGVVCYGVDGSERWRNQFGPERPGKHRNGSGSNPSPATDGKHLVVYFKSGTIACLSLDGKEMWRINLQELYGPDKLWWDLVEKYQGLKRPSGRNAPDYGSKIHIVSAPVYYHNYMMGQLFASQVHHAICREVYNGADPNSVVYVGDKRVGEFMRKKVFGPGALYDWRGLTRNATGEELNPKAFAADFKGK